MAARHGRRGRRSLSELDAGRPAGGDALGPGGGRRARRGRPAAREPVAGQPPARSGRRPRARAAPLGAAGLGARRPGPHRCARGAGTRAAGRHPRAGTRARGGRPGCRSLRRPGPAHHATPWTAFHGRPPVGPLATALADIHAVDPAGIPPTAATTSPTAWPCRPGPPIATSGNGRSPWPTAPPPELPERFIHRDFHPGNTLWEGAELTGVVDWTTGSRGPAAVDLGHLRWNLALDYGQRVADALLPHPEHDPYYDVVTALDVLPELEHDLHARRAAAPRGARRPGAPSPLGRSTCAARVARRSVVAGKERGREDSATARTRPQRRRQARRDARERVTHEGRPMGRPSRET